MKTKPELAQYLKLREALIARRKRLLDEVAEIDQALGKPMVVTRDKNGLSGRKGRVLHVVRDDGRVAEIVRRTGIRHAHVSFVLRELIKMGLVLRVRRGEYALTEDGEEAANA